MTSHIASVKMGERPTAEKSTREGGIGVRKAVSVVTNHSYGKPISVHSILQKPLKSH